jgi:MoxR-like ATPase
MRFRIIETDREIVAKERPVVIITSNNEKDLPDAFLRRCVFHFIDFPDQELMKRIVEVHHPNLPEKLSEQALSIFYELRALTRLRKRPELRHRVLFRRRSQAPRRQRAPAGQLGQGQIRQAMFAQGERVA